MSQNVQPKDCSGTNIYFFTFLIYLLVCLFPSYYLQVTCLLVLIADIINAIYLVIYLLFFYRCILFIYIYSGGKSTEKI